MLSIKIAEYGDLDAVVSFCLSALNEIEMPAVLPIEPIEIDHNVRKNWNEAPCFLLLEGKEKIVGFAGFCLSRAFFSARLIMKDYMFFILPEHRNVRNLRLLCDAARHFAAQNNLLLQVNYIAGQRPQEQQRLMKQMGFKVTGFTGVANG